LEKNYGRVCAIDEKNVTNSKTWYLGKSHCEAGFGRRRMFMRGKREGKLLIANRRGNRDNGVLGPGTGKGRSGHTAYTIPRAVSSTENLRQGWVGGGENREKEGSLFRQQKRKRGEQPISSAHREGTFLPISRREAVLFPICSQKESRRLKG